jgi:hypothetical protein
LTVGATTSADAQASYSNFGPCLDLYAPGSSVTSAYYTSDTATATMSGTSMASPHVAGAAALYLETNPTASPAAVAQAIRDLATQNHVSGAGAGSPNLLLHSLFAGGSPADTTPPQTSITSPTGGTVSGTVTIAANASDASGVERVEFYVGSALKCTDMSASYTCSWNTTTAANGSYTLTTKAYDTWGNGNTSAPVSVTVNNVVVTPSLVANGGLEGTPSPWTFSGHASWASGMAHTGSSYALLGNRNRANGSVSQSGAIPAAAIGTLTFWLSVTSNDSSASATDVIYVEVIEGSTTSLLGTFSNLNKGAAGAYSLKSFSVAAWRGKTVTLRFRATTNHKQSTSFSVDDVSLQ